MRSDRQYRRSTFHCEEGVCETGPQRTKATFATQAAAFQHAETTGHLITEVRTEVIYHRHTKKHPNNKTKERK